MAVEIRILWDGEVPGIAAHRLSLAAFGEPLTHLLAALRRIATQMVGSAVESERPQIGRFANVARQLDIEIERIEGNSTGIVGPVSYHPPPDELALFADLPERAVTELFEAIERESQGHASNAAVRKYLSTLPRTIRHQTYELHENGTIKKRVEIGEVKLTELPEELPSLREVTGSIVGVGFDPGRSEVRVKGEGSTSSFDALGEQVEAALAIRKEIARSLGVHEGRRTRLLRIEKASEPRFAVTREAIEEHIFKRWDGVFARLAK
jgi:hypothetical protein